MEAVQQPFSHATGVRDSLCEARPWIAVVQPGGGKEETTEKQVSLPPRRAFWSAIGAFNQWGSSHLQPDVSGGRAHLPQRDHARLSIRRGAIQLAPSRL